MDPVPFLVTSVANDKNVIYGLTSTGNVTKFHSSVNVPSATQEELEVISTTITGSASGLFRASRVLQMEALAAMATGANILAAICLGAALEARLTELCQFVCWEAEEDPAVTARAITGRGGVSNLCFALLGKHLKGNWNRNNSGAVYGWDQKIVKLKNEAAHNGYEPRDIDLDEALEAFQVLEEHICDCLKRQIASFHYLSSDYMGHARMKEIGVFNRWQKVIESYPLTLDPDGSFQRYKVVVRQLASASHGEYQPKAPLSRVRLTGDQIPERWFQLDFPGMMCREVCCPDHFKME